MLSQIIYSLRHSVFPGVFWRHPPPEIPRSPLAPSLRFLGQVLSRCSSRERGSDDTRRSRSDRHIFHCSPSVTITLFGKSLFYNRSTPEYRRCPGHLDWPLELFVPVLMRHRDCRRTVHNSTQD